MSAVVEDGVAVSAATLTTLHATLDTLLAADLTAESDAAVLDALREAERLRRRLSALDHVLVTQAEQRGLGYTSTARDTAGLLVRLLRISAREAHARVRSARDCGPRTALSGEILPPVFADVAAAQAAGTVSPEQARIITRTERRLPADVDPDYAATVRRVLLQLAGTSGPEKVAAAAERAVLLADPDGPEPTDEPTRRRRALTVRPRADGSAAVHGELSAECAEFLQTYLDTHAAPHPQSIVDGQTVTDPRTATQRRHDALLDGLRRLVSLDDAADTGTGNPVNVILLLDLDAWHTGRGHASTGHGAIIPARDAIRWAGGDAKITAVVLNSLREVSHYSDTHRIFTRNQRLAMTARDKGCTFPGCTAPPGWTEAHHVTDFATTARTSVDDGALACGYDHRQRIDVEGWTTTMINGTPHWVPPPWLDPTQTPIRNTLHDLE